VSLLLHNAAEAGAREPEREREPEIGDEDVVPLRDDRLRVDDRGVGGIDERGEGVDRVEGTADRRLPEAGSEEQRLADKRRTMRPANRPERADASRTPSTMPRKPKPSTAGVPRSARMIAPCTMFCPVLPTAQR